MARVLVLSDLHLRGGGGTVRGVDTRRALEAVLAHARAAGPYDRVVLLGDVAEDGRAASYRLARELLGDWAPDALVLAGNHDRPEALRDELGADPEGFVVDEGGWRLVGAHSFWRGRVAGRLGPPALERIERALGGDRPAVVFLHHPPVNVGTPWLDWTRLADGPALAAVLGRTRAARAVIHGHVHMASEATLAGVRVVGMPSTAFQFVPGSLLPRRGSPAHGYRVLELADGVDIRAVYVGSAR
jgi:Icc protein